MGMGMGMGEEEEEEEEGHDAGSRTRPAIPPSHDARHAAVRGPGAPIRGRPYHHLTYRRARTRASSTYHPRHTLLQKYNNTFRHVVL